MLISIYNFNLKFLISIYYDNFSHIILEIKNIQLITYFLSVNNVSI